MKKIKKLTIPQSSAGRWLTEEEESLLMAGSNSFTLWPCFCGKVGDKCESGTVTWSDASDISWSGVLGSLATLGSVIINPKTIFSPIESVSALMDLAENLGLDGYTTEHQCIKYPYDNVFSGHKTLK